MSLPRASWRLATCLNQGFKCCSAFLRGKVPCSPKGVVQGVVGAEVSVSSKVPGAANHCRRRCHHQIRSAAAIFIQTESFPSAKRCSKHLTVTLISLGSELMQLSGPFCRWDPGRWSNSPRCTQPGLQPSCPACTSRCRRPHGHAAPAPNLHAPHSKPGPWH